MEFITIISGSAIGSGFILLFFKIVEKWFDEIFAHNRLAYTDRRALADEVIRLCSEAKHAEFNVKPRSYEHVMFIANKVRVEDEKVGKIMEEFATAWMLCGQLQSKQQILGIDEETIISVCGHIKETARINYEELLRMIKKWKK